MRRWIVAFEGEPDSGEIVFQDDGLRGCKAIRVQQQLEFAGVEQGVESAAEAVLWDDLDPPGGQGAGSVGAFDAFRARDPQWTLQPNPRFVLTVLAVGDEPRKQCGSAHAVALRATPRDCSLKR